MKVGEERFPLWPTCRGRGRDVTIQATRVLDSTESHGSLGKVYNDFLKDLKLHVSLSGHVFAVRGLGENVFS